MIKTLLISIEGKDWILLALGILGSVIWPFIIYQIRPKLKIDNPFFSNKVLKIPVLNDGLFDAINIKIEACSVFFDDMTYHFLIDKEEFIAIRAKRKSSKANTVHEKIF